MSGEFLLSLFQMDKMKPREVNGKRPNIALVRNVNFCLTLPYKRLIHFFFFFCIFCPHPTVCGVLVSQPGIKTVPPALRVWSPNHCATSKVPSPQSLLINLSYLPGTLSSFFPSFCIRNLSNSDHSP